MKKMVALLVASSLFTGQTAYAEEITVAFEEKVDTSEIYESNELEEVSVDSELTEFVDVFQEVAIELTEGEKSKLLLLVEFISQKNEKLQGLLVTGQYEKAVSMIEKYNVDVNRVQELLETSVTDETAVEDLEIFEEIEENFAEKTSMRGVNLKELLESGELPAPALTGIEKALANQERAQERKEQRKASKEEKKADKQEGKEDISEEAEVEEVIASSLDKKQGKPDKAQKALEKAAKQVEKGKEKAAKALQKASQRGKGNNGKDK